MKNRPLRVTDLAWDFLRAVIAPGDIAVDATAGVLTFNGNAVGGKPVDPKVVKLH